LPLSVSRRSQNILSRSNSVLMCWCIHPGRPDDDETDCKSTFIGHERSYYYRS